jgi:hypothetical protein
LPKKLPVCVIRKRGPGRYSSPAKSSKSQPFEIVTTRPRGSSFRASSAIASETHVIASARRATSRATLSCAFCLARAPRESERRCGCATSESRRSATHFAPVALCTAAPTRWTEPGGEVVSTASILCCLAIRSAAGIEVRFQLTFSSGTSRRREARRA